MKSLNKYFYINEMNDTLSALNNDIIKVRVMFNSIRDDAYDLYKASGYNDSVLNDIVENIKNSFQLQRNIDEGIDDLKSIINELNDEITCLRGVR